MKKTGLVLEGGGMRGIYTAGVLDLFMDRGLAFDGVIGVSAGAIHGCSFLSRQRGRNIRYYKKYCRDWRFMSLRNLLFTGDIAGEKFCYHTLPEQLDPFDYETFNRNPAEFYVCCSNVKTGKPEYLHLTDMKEQIDYLRASASLPLVSRIVKAGGKLLLDGGCTDSIPVKAFMEMGYVRNVVILTRHRGYRKKDEGSSITRARYHRYPEFVKAVEQRPQVYNRTLEEIEVLEKEGSAFVIRPSIPLTIGRMEKNPQKLQSVYELGYQDGARCLVELLEWRNRL